MASGWNLWVCVECIGVVSGWCCKEVYKYPHNNYYFSLLHLYYIALFWQQHPYFFVHFKNVFSFFSNIFRLYIVILFSNFSVFFHISFLKDIIPVSSCPSFLLLTFTLTLVCTIIYYHIYIRYLVLPRSLYYLSWEAFMEEL